MKYNIVIVANEGYVQHAGVMLCSLFETNKTKRFGVYLLTDGISATSSTMLKELCENYNSRLIVKLPEEDLGSVLGVNLKDLPVGQWNTMMYYKLFIPTVLPREIDRCLFLDVDIIINDDISELYNWRLGEAVIAAAEDMPDCVEIKRRIGLSQEDKYINSGVMVCDLEKWREEERKNHIFGFVKSVESIIINEQDVIALYFRKKLSFLPIRWNMTTFYFLRKPKIFDKYLPDLYEAKRNPGIIHFAAPIKPWFKDCTHPYRHLYKKYLQITQWREWKFVNWEQLSPRKRLNKIIKNLLNEYNILKEPLYTKI